jgi:hypothetical protein
MMLRAGVELLEQSTGSGAEIRRYEFYRFRLRMFLSRGDAVAWSKPWGLLDNAVLEDDGRTLITDLRVDREFMFPGLFYGVHGMRIGGTRTLRIAPHLAFGAAGITGAIPANAVLTVEVHVRALPSG